MISLYKNIKKRRLHLGLTQTDLAQKLGYADKSMIAKIENGKVDLPQSKIEAFAKALEVTPSYLMGWDASDDTVNTRPPKPRGVKIPVLGDVAAGIPIEAIEDVLDYEEIEPELATRGEYFGLRIKGNSMSPRIQNGDVVIVRLQPDADSGDIVIAKVNGDDACCKKLLKHGDSISLVSFNADYDPMYFSRREIIEKPVSIIGKVVELRGKF